MKKDMILILGMVVAVAGVSSCNPSRETGRSTKSNASTTSSMGSDTGSHEALTTGIQQLKQANVIEAIRSFDDAIRRDPSNVRAYLILAETYLRFNQPQRAIDTLTAAARLAPPSGDVHYLLAMAYGLTGQRQRALAHAMMAARIYQEQNDQDNVLRALALAKGLQEALAAQLQPTQNTTASSSTQPSKVTNTDIPASGVSQSVQP